MNSKQPLAVTCTGGKPNLPGAEVPETATIAIEYPENYLAMFTLGYKAMRYDTFNDQIKQFHGNKARFDVGREWYALYPESNAIDMKPTVERRSRAASISPAPSHIRNFLECIGSRKEPNAPVEAGQATNIVLWMAMDSFVRDGGCAGIHKRRRWTGEDQLLTTPARRRPGCGHRDTLIRPTTSSPRDCDHPRRARPRPTPGFPETLSC